MPSRHRSRQPSASSGLDLSYARAATVVIPRDGPLHLVLVGCGGTGGWLAPSLARITRLLREAGRGATLTFVDPDVVEARNIPRQNFCDAELGQPKAVTLAARYGQAWGVEIRAVHARFTPDMVRTSTWHPVIVVGCVDNAPARRSIADTFKGNMYAPRVWWLDCGNWFQSGQVLLGCAPEAGDLRDSFRGPTLCAALPSPALQHPELLEARPEELEDSRLSPRNSGALGCAEIAARSAQSLVVNQRVATEAADFLTRLAFGGLKRFATYFDLASGTAKSRYVTPETVAEITGLPVKALVAPPARLSPRNVPR